MPYTYRHPRVIFPGLSTHPLYDTFQDLDKAHILPEGKPIFVPFSAANMIDEFGPLEAIDILIATPPNSYLRFRRIHMWIEPDMMYPRGTKLSLSLKHVASGSSKIYTVYSGMYYIIPVDIEITNTLSADIKEVTYADQMVHDTDHISYRMYFMANGFPMASEDYPIFTALAELR